MSLRSAVLELLSIRPTSGYELKKLIDSSVGHFRSADQSQIYRTLNGLVDGQLDSRTTAIQDERLASLEGIEVPDAQHDLAQMLRFASLDSGILHARAEQQWIDAVLARLREYDA